MIKEVYAMKKFLKIMLIIIGAISLIFVALIGIGLFVDVEYDDHIEMVVILMFRKKKIKIMNTWNLR